MEEILKNLTKNGGKEIEQHVDILREMIEKAIETGDKMGLEKRKEKFDARKLGKPTISKYKFIIEKVDKELRKTLNYALAINLIDEIKQQDKDFDFVIETPSKNHYVSVRYGRVEKMEWGKDEE